MTNDPAQLAAPTSLPPENATHARLIPSEKALPDDWEDRLRGSIDPQRLSGDALRYVGMPVGGICAGQVYLSGDGRLCQWDVFKAYGGRKDTGDPHGPHYAQPQVPDQPFLIGFGMRTGDGRLRTLDAQGFRNVDFEGRYPIGTVRFSDDDCPILVRLEAFSPFVPLDAGDSGLPATLLHYSFTNYTSESQELSVAAWLENAVCRFDPRSVGQRLIKTERSDAVSLIHCHAALDTTAPTDGWGSMTLALLKDSAVAYAQLTGTTSKALLTELLSDSPPQASQAAVALDQSLVGGLAKALHLAPGETVTLQFVVAWHFPRYSGGRVFFSTMEDIPNLDQKRRYYATRFEDSRAVVRHLEQHVDHLAATTRLWSATWYDSSLPRWFLDRTFLNTSILATQTAHRFEDGRFYGWEGVDSCPGTCQHVWQYAQAVGAIFPELERFTREYVDYGIAYHADGSMDYRAEASSHGDQAVAPDHALGEAIMAVDGSAGTIIRVLREHKHSADLQFLQRLWPRVRKSMEFLMRFDLDGDGLLEGPQYNTLDATWYGKIPWISSLYLAALSACKRMADDIGDEAFAQECSGRLDVGRRSFVTQLFNGRYFVHRGDVSRPGAADLQEGCYIDQVLGQSFAHQVGMERVVSATHSVSALQSLWRYNFAVDVGPYREGFKDVSGGRWYAMPGEAGMLMCTWPQAPYDPSGRKQADLGLGITSEGYLNECMTGFEYQVAAHMMAEGLVHEGLSVTRAIHERYAPERRNPWNEVECGDHYSRAMASYGVFITACGFDYDGPAQSLTMDPKLDADDFKAPVVLAEGWGTYAQRQSGEGMEVILVMRHGRTRLKTLCVRPPAGQSILAVEMHQGGNVQACAFTKRDDEGALLDVELGRSVELDALGESGLRLIIRQRP